MKRNVLFSIILTSLFFMSCNKDKEYKLIIEYEKLLSDNHLDYSIIEFDKEYKNDTIAYIEAYTSYCIAIKNYYETGNKQGYDNIEQPTGFTLYKNGKKIEPEFETKISKELEIYQNIIGENKIPKSYKNLINKAKRNNPNAQIFVEKNMFTGIIIYDEKENYIIYQSRYFDTENKEIILKTKSIANGIELIFTNGKAIIETDQKITLYDVDGQELTTGNIAEI